MPAGNPKTFRQNKPKMWQKYHPKTFDIRSQNSMGTLAKIIVFYFHPSNQLVLFQINALCFFVSLILSNLSHFY